MKEIAQEVNVNAQHFTTTGAWSGLRIWENGAEVQYN